MLGINEQKCKPAVVITSAFIIILLLMLFLILYVIPKNRSRDIDDVLSKYKISEEDELDEYLFSPEEIETAVAIFLDIIVPEYVPERFQMSKLEVFCWGNGPEDEYNGYFYYDDTGHEEEGRILLIKISNKQWPLSNVVTEFVVDAVEFDSGFITYIEDPLGDETFINKKWMTGESILLVGVLTREEADEILEGIPLEF